MSDLTHMQHASASAPAGLVPATANTVVGYFRDVPAFKAAVVAARAAGYSHTEVHMPYPVHGVEGALGLKRSWIGRPVLAVSLVVAALAFLMQYHQQVEEFPMIYSGKPYFTWQLYVVVTMESGLLLGALLNLLLCFHTCQLLPDPFWRPRNDRLSDDTFAVVVTDIRAAEVLVAWMKAQGAVGVDVDPAPGATPAPVGAAHA